MKFFSALVSQVSIGGVLLKAEKTAEGWILDLEDGAKHVETLISHGFEVVEEKVATILRRPGSSGSTGGGETGSGTNTGAATGSGEQPSAPGTQSGSGGSNPPPLQ